MSVHKLQIEFSISAQKDVDDILAYTLENWGNKQLAAYRSKINQALRHIASNPTKGIRHDGELYEHLVERHRIFYRIRTYPHSTVSIIRILHQRMDTAQHL